MSQPLSSFEQTVLDTEEQFYATFPAAIPAAQDVNGVFGGPYLQYDAGSGYTAVGETPQSRAHNLSIFDPTHSLHYDYPSLSEDLAWRNTRPLTFGPTAQNSGPLLTSPNQHYSPMGIVSYAEPSTSTAHQIIPSLQPSTAYARPEQTSHKYGQYLDFKPTLSASTSNAILRSPIDAPNGIAFLPPDSPSDGAAASPRSDFEEIRTAIPIQDALIVNRLQVQPSVTVGGQEITNAGGTVGNISSPNPSRASNRQARSFSQHPSQGDNVLRGIPWNSPHSGTPRPSMRLSPLPTKRQLEKKPPLACLFCRGRKIACGPPLPGSTDKTCNQCQRRSLRCEYPSESRRGMRKKKTADPIDQFDKSPGTSLSSSTETTGSEIP
ncbi:hypothetical protein GALMADRAFT_248753 [Galerina marginata CBS 339.88]|uniref:Zn(2)-C6 fungal-type domain-containing protein n=1 Tax=Galerina marginata (strain CBS 339.88) TaxID=685588 RepID=A0A067TAG4_GALM3|nr:hypothetical protein GALMADRAFT_248753 [Galerina marginata CBS 339.88]